MARIMRPIKDFTVKERQYPCGCKEGIEFSSLAWGATFFDHCGTHAGGPDKKIYRVEFFK